MNISTLLPFCDVILGDIDYFLELLQFVVTQSLLTHWLSFIEHLNILKSECQTENRKDSSTDVDGD